MRAIGGSLRRASERLSRFCRIFRRARARRFVRGSPRELCLLLPQVISRHSAKRSATCNPAWGAITPRCKEVPMQAHASAGCSIGCAAKVLPDLDRARGGRPALPSRVRRLKAAPFSKKRKRGTAGRGSASASPKGITRAPKSRHAEQNYTSHNNRDSLPSH